MGPYHATQSYLYNQIFWVAEDTIYKLPAMNVNPDSITAGGFSGGSFYATIFHVVNSATIKGVHLRAGGPYSFGYAHSGQPTLDDQYVQDAIALAQENSDLGLIDNVSNLDGAPVKIMSCLQDDSQMPVLQQAQKSFYDSFGSVTDLEEFDVVHTTSWFDPQLAFKFLLPKIAGSGYTNADELEVAPYSDLTYQTEGKMVKFDQRAFTTPGEFSRANLAQWGFAYIPKRCYDGTVDQCTLSVYFFGCGGPPKVWDGSEAAAGVAAQPFGWGSFAHSNDMIMLFPTMRDACWNMQYTWLDYGNDYYFLEKEGA
jgi:hypothetical protein